MKKTNIILDSIPCQVQQMILLVCFLMTSYAYATISTEVTDTVIKYGATDIDILCIVNGTSLKSTDGIQLKKSNTSIVSISNFGIFWQDKLLQTRSKINASIDNVHLSYLHLKILACNVKRTDEGTYYCDLSATNEDFSPYHMSSEQTSLNITGFVDGKTDKCANATISIEVTDTVIKYGATDIDILCTVNGTSLKSTDGIQLKKSNTSIVLISNFGIRWQDKLLQTRSKITASTENVHVSYLHLKILACNVERTDEGTYYCVLSAINEDFYPYHTSSEQTSLNITGFVDGKTDKCGPSSQATFAKGSGFVLMLIATVIAVLK